MKRIVLLSDTHCCTDAAVTSYLSDVDEIWHAGDIGDLATLEHYRGMGHPVRAVHGNIDPTGVRRECPEFLDFECEGVKVLMTHIGGYPGKYATGVKTMIRESGARLFISGHSHILKVIHDRELDCLHINPGAAGNQGWQTVRTLVRFTLDAGDIRDLEVVHLGERGIKHTLC